VPGLLAGAIDGQVFLDVDDTVNAVYGAGMQGAEHGYTRIRGLNAQLATLSTTAAAPVIAAAKLRRGAASSAHGVIRLVRDALATARRAGVSGTSWCARTPRVPARDRHRCPAGRSADLGRGPPGLSGAPRHRRLDEHT